jgi:hypothetical protein
LDLRSYGGVHPAQHPVDVGRWERAADRRPLLCDITITQVLDTKLSVHQLTPDDLRAREITVDANNYDVYGLKLDHYLLWAERSALFSTLRSSLACVLQS